MDLSFLENALALASTAVGVTGKAATTAETIKKLFASDAKPDAGEAAKLLNSLAVELTAANMMNVDLSNALKSLSQQLKAEDDFRRERDRYEIYRTAQSDIVFKLKAEAANGQPDHYICPVCLNSDKLINFIAGEGDYKICQRNRDHIFRFKSSQQQYRSVTSRTNFDGFI